MEQNASKTELLVSYDLISDINTRLIGDDEKKGYFEVLDDGIDIVYVAQLIAEEDRYVDEIVNMLREGKLSMRNVSRISDIIPLNGFTYVDVIDLDNVYIIKRRASDKRVESICDEGYDDDESEGDHEDMLHRVDITGQSEEDEEFESIRNQYSDEDDSLPSDSLAHIDEPDPNEY